MMHQILQERIAYQATISGVRFGSISSNCLREAPIIKGHLTNWLP